MLWNLNRAMTWSTDWVLAQAIKSVRPTGWIDGVILLMLTWPKNPNNLQNELKNFSNNPEIKVYNWSITNS